MYVLSPDLVVARNRSVDLECTCVWKRYMALLQFSRDAGSTCTIVKQLNVGLLILTSADRPSSYADTSAAGQMISTGSTLQYQTIALYHCNVMLFFSRLLAHNYLVLTPILCLFVQFFVLHQDYTFIHQNFAWDNELCFLFRHAVRLGLNP